ncbi:MAG TPA: ATP-binding protein [Bryobacteraceae bacterium]|jgi:signal transduction histidine kinase|nr:ATP-binding protein [Bryobacteraceae bacterium]
MYRQNDLEMRVVVLAPTGRDAVLLSKTLQSANITAEVCDHPRELLAMLEHGAAAVMVAEEALLSADIAEVAHWLASQPPWSDIPFIVITSRGRANAATTQKARELQVMGNVTLLERPVRPETVEAAARSALRARMRQYEIRRRQEVLVRVNADLEQFAYTASHDLQEPIRNIAIYSELLNQRYGHALDDTGQEFLRYVNAGARRMEMLVRDLLAYTKAASISDETTGLVDTDKSLQNALSNLAEAIRQSGAELTYPSLPAVRMREVHLQQLFQNLIGNAIKYRSADQPRITISAEKNDGHWRFGIGDNGIGISPEYKDRIFGLFKRLHANEEYSGTGIGLAICQRIVDRYRGRIWVESEPGKGSTFFFTIPG